LSAQVEDDLMRSASLGRVLLTQNSTRGTQEHPSKY
jgi:hypothetical protein